MGTSNSSIDMLNGSLLDKIVKFALPLAISSVMQQFFNSVDMAVVGHFSGKEALAAVGSNSAVINLVVSLFVGLSVGANVIVANRIGENNNLGIKTINYLKEIYTVICINFYIVNTTCPEPYNIYWKVRNNGPIAEKSLIRLTFRGETRLVSQCGHRIA